MDRPAHDVGEDELPAVDRLVEALPGETFTPRRESDERGVPCEVGGRTGGRLCNVSCVATGQPRAGEPKGQDLLDIHSGSDATGSGSSRDLTQPRCAMDSCRVPDNEQASAADSEFYDTTYAGFADQLNATIRSEAFGEEIGQNSWLTADEQRRFSAWLELGASSDVLEVASGSGGPALFMVRETGCRVTGIDLHDRGVAAANEAAADQGLSDRARFVRVDAREPLPFDDGTFDALLCIDSINHMYERARVLGEWHRVLRSGGRLLFTDPITLTGMIRREEMVVRSGSMGEFVFTPPGVDEALLKAAGFGDIRAEDVTPNMAAVAAAWRRARSGHVADLDQIEGAGANARFQEFLGVVERLASERRLSRVAYLARKP